MSGASPVGLSIVTSMYRSAAYLEEFYARAADAASSVATSWEMVLVNDGSPDESRQVALDLRRRDPRVRVLDLSRNFGHHRALMTGLTRARGRLVYLVDCDLEERPEWLRDFSEAMIRTGVDAVYGVQETRKGGWLERATGAFFFSVVNRLLDPPLPANVVTARLMTQRFVRALVSHREREVSLAGLCVMTGFDQLAITVVKGRRGDSSYTVRRRISVLVNAITSFSNRPLIFIFYLGIMVMLVSILAAGWLVMRSVTARIGVPGYASLMVSIWFLGGLTIFCLGIIGVYLAKVFSESKARPYAIIRSEHGPEEAAGEDSVTEYNRSSTPLSDRWPSS
jgi:putative glycosyltransferase